MTTPTETALAILGLSPEDGLAIENRRAEQQAREAQIRQHYEALLHDGESLAIVYWAHVTILKSKLDPYIQEFLDSKLNSATVAESQLAARRGVLGATYYNYFGVQEADFRFLPPLDDNGAEMPASQFVFPLAVVRNKRTEKAELVK